MPDSASMLSLLVSFAGSSTGPRFYTQSLNKRFHRWRTFALSVGDCNLGFLQGADYLTVNDAGDCDIPHRR